MRLLVAANRWGWPTAGLKVIAGAPLFMFVQEASGRMKFSLDPVSKIVVSESKCCFGGQYSLNT